MPPLGSTRHTWRLAFLPALTVALVVWAVVAAYTLTERGQTLERAEQQLGITVSTLVEVSVLAERAAQVPARPGDPDRAAAFWRVLLQYPTAWIWIEAEGKTMAGQPPAAVGGPFITVAATSGGMTAHAALSVADALADWRRAVWQRAIALLVVSTGCLLLADRLARALAQRTATERVAALAEERAAQLGRYRVQLEETVAQRTAELRQANAIVQNSPTLLFRLRGEPSLPLIYISQNIVKYGHDPASLIAAPDWQLTLIDPADRAKVLAALTGVLEHDASSASIEFRLIKGDGTRRWMEARYSPVRDSMGRLAEIEGLMIDVTDRKAAEAAITLLARTDPLTGLANRATFAERLHLAFTASRRGGALFAVLYLDIDHFKNINDTQGHPTGDALLQAVAGRLSACVRETDLVARLGGDEFAVLQADMAEPATAGTLAEKIRLSLSQPFTFGGLTLHVTTSIGVAPASPDTPDANTMLAQADLALYRAKEEGRDQYRFHSKDLDVAVGERVTLGADLREALVNGELEMQYQPQVDLASGAIVGMEALARWHHPTRGLVMPAIFIPIAEKTGAILELGRWSLDQACGQMHRWRLAGIAPPVMAVNISLFQLKNGQDFIRGITETLAKWQLTPHDLELDVTEATLAQIAWTQNEVLTDLRKLGIRMALDDFGTDYSSFDYLRRYRVSHVKIAQSFTRQASESPEQAQTVRAIIGLAGELGIGVIAEGIETASQRALLVAIGGPTEGQGFYFSPALTEPHATTLLHHNPFTTPATAG